MQHRESTSAARPLPRRLAVTCTAALISAAAGALVAVEPQTGTRQGGAPAAQQPTGAAEGRGGREGGRGRGQAPELPIIPGTPWRIHDMTRPRPVVVTPGATVGAPPSDAIVLFDGTDLSKWAGKGGSEAKWPIRDGYVESAGTGSITTREAFGSIQLHLEFATPAVAKGDSQGRGNSGVIFMGRYEIQVLDSYNNDTYPDGQAAAIYGDWPPLVNVARKPGEWQTYDIVFEAPRFNSNGSLLSPAYATVFWNGVIVHNRQRIAGPTSPTQTVHQYDKPHEAELPLTLQDHSNPVRFRNIWVRRLKGYDQN